jgi:hypothetical protein
MFEIELVGSATMEGTVPATPATSPGELGTAQIPPSTPSRLPTPPCIFPLSSRQLAGYSGNPPFKLLPGRGSRKTSPEKGTLPAKLELPVQFGKPQTEWTMEEVVANNSFASLASEILAEKVLSGKKPRKSMS